jgi:hypothetical protein
VTLDEFFAAVKSEPDLVEWYFGSPGCPEQVTEVYAGPWQIDEQGGSLLGHRLGNPLSDLELAAFRKRFPGVALPEDLLAVLQRWNGIDLWADVEFGRSYEGLAPLEEWDLARGIMLGPDADPGLLSDRYFALSYHADGSAFVVLDTSTAKYFWMDSCGADESCPIGDTGDELLTWLWNHRMTPPAPTNVWNDPRTLQSQTSARRG